MQQKNSAASRRKMVAGNWKMHGDFALVRQFNEQLRQSDLQFVDVLVCPPFPYLHAFAQADFALGAQNLSAQSQGAHTGEVAASMLLENGCNYVLVGHSERRSDQQESNQIVANKAQQAIDAGLTPIVCIGEDLQVRQQGQLFDFLAEQLDAVLDKLGVADFAKSIVAYEPVWAIGTGQTASPEQAQEVHGFIRQHLAKQDAQLASQLRILYGGSVKADNAKALFAQPDIDGGLIGGASLKIDEFIKICQAAD